MNLRRAYIRSSCLWILADNTHIRSSFYTVYSQPDISDESDPLFFSRLVEDGDRRCHSDHEFGHPLWAGSLFPPIFRAQASREGLLMRLVIFVNTIFHLHFTDYYKATNALAKHLYANYHQLRSHQFCRQRIPKSLWERRSPSSAWRKKIGAVI